jgi:hypothetical protein
MTYGTCSAGWRGGVMCSTRRGRTWPAARCGGGRGGASSFPVRGRRTLTAKARMSFAGVQGCFSPTQFGRRWGGGWSPTVG